MDLLFVFKIKKAVKQTKKMLDANRDLTKEVKRIIGNIKQDVEILLSYLPQFKPIYKEFVEIIKKCFK